jgi:putative heme transporter
LAKQVMQGDGDASGEAERDVSLPDGDADNTSAVTRPLSRGLPDWLQTLGRGAWLLVGIAALLAIAFFLLGLISDLLIPLVFAAILAAIFVPLVDRLERWHLARWLGAPLVVLLAIGVVALVGWMVVAGLLGREREILAQVAAGLDEAGSLAGVAEPDTDQAMKTAGTLVQTLLTGLLSGLSSATVLIVGIVTGLFILLFLMKDWRLVFDGASNRIAALLGLPTGVGRQIVSDTVHSFRGYAGGLTIVGLMNGVVVGLGAIVLGVPLALPIAIVTFVTSYPVLRRILRRRVRRADRAGRQGPQRCARHARDHAADQQHPAEPPGTGGVR